METFGSIALIPKVEDARDMARQSQLTARRGINPVDVKRSVKQLEAEKGSTTFRSVAEKYFKLVVNKKQQGSTSKETRRVFEKDIFPKWSKRDISTITSKDVRALHNAVSERSEIMADPVLIRLRTFFRWAVRQELIGKNPTASIDKLAHVVERDRILTDDEIVSFWSACETIGWPYGPLFKLLLLTAQRRDEVAGMEWSEFDIDNKLWVIPRERTKSDRIHELHLSDIACEILGDINPINNSKFIFTTDGFRHVNGWSSAKHKLDKEMGCTDWRLHDLRRTAASGMARLNILPHVVDKILNHSSGSIRGVAAVYNRYEYGDERRRALEAWSHYVKSLIESTPSNVLNLRQGALTAT
jgi:integrase